MSIHVVTGTTGLVGSAVILELLRQTDVEVIGIVRSHTRPVGERLYAALENAQRAYGYEDGVLRAARKRCHAMAGDVTASSNRFWEIIGTAYRKQNLMLRKGVAMKEVLYPCAPTSRFNAQKGVPAILQTTLPHLTQDHDRLFDEIRRFVLG